jgi:glucose 1-dehydrogenase
MRGGEPNPDRLKGRRAIVTGGGRGIGLACVRRLVAEGARVLLVDRDPSAEAAAADLGPSARFHLADVLRPGAVEAIVEAAVSAFGGVDILVNNAGVVSRSDLLDLSAEEFDRVLGVNLRAPFLLTQAVGRRMRDQGTGGAIVNMSSINAVLSGGDSLAYCVSKGGLNQLTRVCAIALAPYNIRVNGVGPGTIATEMAAQFGLTGDGVRAVLERTPAGRLGEPEEIASAVAFLASDEASFIIGQTVYADGARLGLNYSLPVERVG